METMTMTKPKKNLFRVLSAAIDEAEERFWSFVALCIVAGLALSAAIIETAIIIPGIIVVILKTPSSKPINWDWIWFVTRYFSPQLILTLLITTFESKETIALLP